MKINRVTVANDSREARIKKLMPPKNKYEIAETDGTSYNNGYTIYLSKGSDGKALQHELLHITSFVWEDRFKREVLNAGKTVYVKSHPLAHRYSEREFISEDFVASAEDWIRGNSRTTIRMGWQTEEESESRMNFFDKHFG